MKTPQLFNIRAKSGQIVVQYVLLLVLSVGIVTLVLKKVASRNSDEPGILIQKWCLVLKAIGSDVSDENKSPSKSMNANQSSSTVCP